ncbi:MAG TPA: hypothetical protein VFR24_01905 [Candidatus Angelobacter sp.]|nr:hypothetical protein [Candidatus Angelobacter sp.]
MEIRPRSSDSSRYAVAVQLGGQNFFGLLTYDLLRPELGRSVVLLSAEAMQIALSDEQKKGLNTLGQLLNDTYRLDTESRMARAKSLVKMIAEGTVNYTGKAIVVHRFGAVPAVAIDTDLTHVLPNGEQIKIRLAAFPGINNQGSNLLLFPPGTPSTVHLLESLRLQMPLLFRRYFEDAAEILWSIQRKADLAKVLSWTKAIETGIGESVKTKLDVLLPEMALKRPAKKIVHKDMVAQSVREERPSIVLQAAYGRLLLLYFVNFLYGLIGIRPEKKYEEKLDSFVTDYGKYIPVSTILQAFEEDVDLHDLKAIRDNFESSIKSESPVALPEVPMANAKDTPEDQKKNDYWVRKVAEFSRFLAVLHKRGASEPEHKGYMNDPGYAKIFFSSVHLVPSGVEVLSALKATLPHPQSRAVLLSVQEPAGAGFKELISARLWLSDALLALVPREPRRYDGTKGGYGWIASESALALVTNRSLSFSLETGVVPEHVSNDFDKLDKDLLHWVDPHDAVNQLNRHFNNNVRGEYQITDPARPLDDRLQIQLQALVQVAILDRTNKLVRGFLDQFPPEMLANCFILQQARGVQSTWMAGLLKNSIKAGQTIGLDEKKRQEKAVQKFYSLFAAANARAIVINGTAYPLMYKQWNDPKSKRYNFYYWNLTNILKELRPSATGEEIDEWEKDLLTTARRRAEETLLKRQAASAAAS